jgi:hypothetical protein
MLNKNMVAIGLVLAGSLLNAAQHPNIAQVTSLDQLSGIKRVIVAGNALEHKRDLGNLLVHHDESGFKVHHERGVSEVQPHNTSKELRGLSTDTIAKMLASGDSYLKVKQYSDGEYGVDIAGRLQGGGPLLASFGCHIGVVGFNILGHGVLYIAAALTGPGAPVVYPSLAAAYGPWILATSKGVGIGLGVLGGMAPTP